MDVIQKLFDLVAPLIAIFSVLIVLPPYLVVTFILKTIKSIFSEDVANKVVLISGASSGIGEHLAYEYAKRGACLVLAARRENRLGDVAARARELGSPDVLVLRADVCMVEDCKMIVDQTLNHFGRLDHLVNNAGILSACLFEDSGSITAFKTVMDTNFWGSVYTTYFALPHLRESKGKIVALSSAGSWLPAPRLSIYVASKAAMLSFFETLRVELRPDINITIVMPGVIESELSKGKFLLRDGKMEVHQELRDVEISVIPVYSVQGCAEAIVNSACRGDQYLTVPAWYRAVCFLELFLPEFFVWICRQFCITHPGTPHEEAISKKMVDTPGAKKLLYPSSLLSSEIKAD